MSGVEYALKRLSVNKSELARRLGVSRMAVQQWESIPYRQSLKLRDKYGLKLEKLNPEVYPPRVFKR